MKKNSKAAVFNKPRQLIRVFRDGIPLPLVVQGALEALQVALMLALLFALPVFGIWLGGGVANGSLESSLQLSGQLWLKAHGVPLGISSLASDGMTEVSGLMTLTPLLFVVIPFLLAWRAGRRIARASYADQLWQGIAGALVAYGFFGFITGFAVRTSDVRPEIWASILMPVLVLGLGVVIGTRREAGSWSRLIGVESVEWLSQASQASRWAGSYVAAVAKASLVAFLSAIALAGIVLAITLFMHWADGSNVYQQLRPGLIGGIVLTLAQLAMIPNLVIWTLSWLGGAGFSIGIGSQLSPLETTVGPLPAVPFLAALPTGSLNGAWLFMLLPVVAGVAAGWWFMREGENHFDDWLDRKLPMRWLSASLSTLFLGLVTGLGAGLLTALVSFISGGSIGIGRLVEIGPHMWLTGAWIALEVGVGVIIGYLVSPYLEPDPVLEN
ncbi:cell division protein PerM [Neomicrococcus lactis]